MKKYLFAVIILIIVAIAVLTSFYGYNPVELSNETNSTYPKNTYAANGISFDYPLGWQQVNKTGKYVIVNIKDPNANSTDGKPGAVVEISRKASEGIPLERFYDEVKAGAYSTPGYQQLSEGKTTVDNLTAYEFRAQGLDNGVEEQFRILLFEKNGFIYMIACGTRSPTYLADEEKNFDMIIKSFKIL